MQMPVEQMDTQLSYIWINVVAALSNANFLILCFLCVQLQLERSTNVLLNVRSKQNTAGSNSEHNSNIKHL